MQCNGFKFRPQNQDCNRIAVKSSVQTSWNPTYKKTRNASPEIYDVGFTKNELIVISHQSTSGCAEFILEPLGTQGEGSLIAQLSDGSTKVLRVGSRYTYELKWGQSLVIRGEQIQHPVGMGAGIVA